MNIELRAARPSDRRSIERTYFETQRWLIEELFGWRGDEFERTKFAESYDESASSIIVASGADVGWLMIVRSGDEIELAQIYIVPESQSRGIGTILVNQLVDEARRNRIPLRLSTAKINPARRLYERLGFVVTHEDQYKVYMEFRDQTSAEPTSSS